LFTTLFFNGFNSKNLFNPKGLTAGLLMSSRAILMITAFTAISFELRNPTVKAVLFKKGFSQLYVSLGLAFGVLPSLLAQIVKPKNIITSPVNQIAQVINYSDYLLQSFQNEVNRKKKLIIISGNPQQGKTTFLKTVISELQKDHITIDGIVAEGIDKEGKRLGFQVTHIKTGKTYPLATITPTPNFIKFGRFYFDTNVFKELNLLLKDVNASYIVIDEIGPLELQGKGWATAIENLLDTDIPMIWVVRKSILEKVTKNWHISHAQIFDIGKYASKKVVNAIKKQLDE
jgi:nucleoside-triphosphatase THEP1